MVLSVVVITRGPTPAVLADVLKKSGRRKLLRAASVDAGRFYHKQFTWRHFTDSAPERYGYKDRRPGYNAGKFLKKGHTRPLVFSGKSRAGARRVDVRPFKNDAKVFIHAPTLNLRNRKSEINMREEVTTVIQSESDKVADFFARSLDKRLSALREVGRKKIDAKQAQTEGFLQFVSD